ncbi:MAG: geranylgeranyl reductase family protein [Rudaea sp.]
MENSYDVIVVGAGPGGSAAAFHLATAGLRTLLLEKEKIPRYKPCGGGLTRKVLREVDSFSPVVEQSVTVASLAFREARHRIAYPRPMAWCVMRPAFDEMLARRAAAAGAELRDATLATAVRIDDGGVVVETGSEKLRARMLVGADGANSIVRRAAGFPSNTALGTAIEIELETAPTSLDEWQATMHADYGAISGGYGWIFPKKDHLSVGVGVFAGEKVPDLRAISTRYIESEPSLAGGKEILRRGHRIPLGGGRARYHARRVVLVGDAAGVVDPFTGEGIYYALRTGRMAAEEIRRAFERDDPSASNYTRRINIEINPDFRWGALLGRTVYRAPRLAYRIIEHSRAAQRVAAELVSGESSYRRLVAAGALGFFKTL